MLIVISVVAGSEWLLRKTLNLLCFLKFFYDSYCSEVAVFLQVIDLGGGCVLSYFVWLVLGWEDCCFLVWGGFMLLWFWVFKFYFHNMLLRALKIEAPACSGRHLRSVQGIHSESRPPIRKGDLQLCVCLG